MRICTGILAPGASRAVFAVTAVMVVTLCVGAVSTVQAVVGAVVVLPLAVTARSAGQRAVVADRVCIWTAEEDVAGLTTVAGVALDALDFIDTEVGDDLAVAVAVG